MASKKKTSSKKAATRPATTAPAATALKKERKPHKPPLERAVRLASSLAKKTPALQINVALWKGEPTAEQRMAQVRTVNNLKKIAPMVDQIVTDLVFLSQSGYAPTVEHLGGRAKTFAVGARVALKEKRYEAAVHGLVNDFTVAGETEKYFQIQAAGGMKGSPILGVPRGWLDKLDPTTPAVGAPTPDDDGEEDDNPGLSPEA